MNYDYQVFCEGGLPQLTIDRSLVVRQTALVEPVRYPRHVIRHAVPRIRRCDDRDEQADSENQDRRAPRILSGLDRDFRSATDLETGRITATRTAIARPPTPINVTGLISPTAPSASTAMTTVAADAATATRPASRGSL